MEMSAVKPLCVFKNANSVLRSTFTESFTYLFCVSKFRTQSYSMDDSIEQGMALSQAPWHTSLLRKKKQYFEVRGSSDIFFCVCAVFRGCVE